MVCSIGRARVGQDDNVKRATENVEQRVALIRDGFPRSCAHLRDAQLYRSAFERRSSADTRTRRSLHRCAHVRRQFSVDSRLPAQATGETHVGHFRPSWNRKPFLIFVFCLIWSQRMFIWSQWCAWSSGFRRKVATAPSFLVAKPHVPVAKPHVPVAKCDYAPGFFEPWSQNSLMHFLPLVFMLLFLAS